MKNIALVIGKKKSVGVPGKNVMKLNGIPSAEYAFMNARKSRFISDIFVSTDSEEIIEISAKYKANVIRRPDQLALSSSLTEDVLTHAFENILTLIPRNEIKTISLFFCNSPLTDVSILDGAIEFMQNDTEYDSCISAARYDMFSPLRAKKISAEGVVMPYCDEIEGNSLRDSTEPTYFIDFGIQVLKPVCFEQMNQGLLPFKWHGKKAKAIVVPYGFDIDVDWQVPVVQYWLDKQGHKA
jgi:CMP-N-acetylneuraminic acid synthetase